MKEIVSKRNLFARKVERSFRDMWIIVLVFCPFFFLSHSFLHVFVSQQLCVGQCVVQASFTDTKHETYIVAIYSRTLAENVRASYMFLNRCYLFRLIRLAIDPLPLSAGQKTDNYHTHKIYPTDERGNVYVQRSRNLIITRAGNRRNNYRAIKLLKRGFISQSEHLVEILGLHDTEYRKMKSDCTLAGE